ncbi:PAS domain-containing hybrid sensor histidine kinase/response regulator [Pelagicoccus albus]|uniref:histidine kinase n=1 Tax=Pelagicoccus albus TaxID=415222 RepID=A0A7X1E8B5_9BACT|nr:PAS domain-containing hybrid sensor histidine kinase/response regulator [Pelagicoccus albus]MBC2606169.1 response regulator [Pelagicoccus albus]
MPENPIPSKPPTLSAALSQREPLLANLWENAPFGILLIVPGPDEKQPVLIGDCNPATCQFHGYSKEELVGQSLDLLHEIHWTTTIDHDWFATPKKDRVYKGSSLHRRKDGSTFLVDYSLTFHELEGCRYAIGFDTPLGLQAEGQKLLALSSRWITAIESSLDGVWEIDIPSQSVWTSPRCQMILGKSPHEEIRSLSELLANVHPKDLKKVEDAFLAIYEDRSGQLDLEVRFQAPERAELWLTLRGKVSYSTDQKPARILGSMTDITGRKKTEVALENALATAESASAAKSKFLAAMSQEIRDPISGALGMANLLASTPLNQKQRRMLKSITTHSGNLLANIDEILYFTNLDAPGFELQNKPFDLVKCFTQSIDTLSPLAASKNVELLFRMGSQTPATVYGDESCFSTVVSKLLENAVKFTEAGEVIVTLEANRAEQQSDGKLYTEISLTVQDTGIGIAPETLPNLFTPFSQASDSTRSHFGGYGLGLATCQRIIDRMGGTISVESSLDQGSLFTCNLKLESGFGLAYPPLPEVKDKIALVLATPSKSTQIILDILEHFSLRTILIENPKQLVESLENRSPFSFLFCDISGWSEPDIAKVDTCLQDISDFKFCRIEVLPVSKPADQPEGGGVGPFSLQKPIDPVAFSQVLQKGSMSLQNSLQGSDTAESFQKEKILVVEDNAINRMLAIRILQKLGFRADSAKDGKDAIKKCDLKPYDIILMDLQLPDISGIQTLKSIRKNLAQSQRAPWTIAATASTWQEDRELCFQAGFDDFLSKPIHPDKLVAAIEKARAAIIPGSK